MQANWSLILNVILLVGVVVAISRVMKAKRQQVSQNTYQPSANTASESKSFDDIIAVRKVNVEPVMQMEPEEEMQPELVIAPVKQPMPRREPQLESKARQVEKQAANKSVMILLMAKENRHLAGYELLQTVLAAGLRVGEGNLFHRHQQANGQGPVLCSLAAATPSGMFDLENMGAFSVRGLCLFMHASGNPTIDAERFEIMVDTAKQLSDGLDAIILDDQRRPFNEERMSRYYQTLNIIPEGEFA